MIMEDQKRTNLTGQFSISTLNLLQRSIVANFQGGIVVICSGPSYYNAAKGFAAREKNIWVLEKANFGKEF